MSLLEQAASIMTGIVLWDLGKWAWSRHRDRYRPRHRRNREPDSRMPRPPRGPAGGAHFPSVQPMPDDTPPVPMLLAPPVPAPTDDSWLVMEDIRTPRFPLSSH